MRNEGSAYEHYQRHGFFVVDDLLSTNQLADFMDHEPRVPVWGKSPQPLQRFRTEPHWRRLVTNEKIVEMLSLLLGSPARVVEAVYLPKSAARPGAGHSGIAFHRDIDHIRTEPATLIGCWIALNQTDVENGGLCVVPGTHLADPVLLEERTSTARSQQIENEMRDRDGRVWIDRFQSDKFTNLDPDRILPLSVAPGGAVFFHGSLIHGSFSNFSPDRERLAVSIHYVAEGSWVLRADIQDTMAVGP